MRERSQRRLGRWLGGTAPTSFSRDYLINRKNTETNCLWVHLEIDLTRLLLSYITHDERESFQFPCPAEEEEAAAAAAAATEICVLLGARPSSLLLLLLQRRRAVHFCQGCTVVVVVMARPPARPGVGQSHSLLM